MKTHEESASAAATAAPGADVTARHSRLVLRTALIAFLTLLSRIAGFVRETKTAALFGDASGVSDAFVTAWRIPNLFRALMAEGAIATSVQTELTRADHAGGERAGRAFFQAMLRLVAWSLCALCLAAMVVAWLLPDRMPLTGWGWLGQDPAAVREFTVRMLPFVVFVCLSAVISGALNVRGHFFAPSIAPAVMNVGWIVALILVARAFDGPGSVLAAAQGEHARQMTMARWLAGYVILAGVILVGVQLPALARFGLAGSTSTGERAAARQAAWSALRASVPIALGAAAYQVNVLASGLLAIALLPEGGSSLLYYVTRLQQLPMSLIAVAATSAVFPMLSALGEKRELGRLRELHDRTHLAVAYVAIPATLGLFLFAEPILAVCFEHGEFSARGVERAVWGLRALALAIPAAGAAGLLARTHFALGERWSPVRVALIVLVAHLALSLFAVVGLGLDIEGLAWSATISAWLNVALLLPGLRRRLQLPEGVPGLLARLGRITLAAAASTGLAWALSQASASERGSKAGLALCILVSVGLYAVFSQLLAIPEWRELWSRLRSGRPPTPG